MHKLLTLILILMPLALAAQQDEPLFPADRPLPRYETDWEREWVEKRLGKNFQTATKGTFGTPPPTGPIECPAEYEPTEGIIMAWEPNYLGSGSDFQVALAQIITSTAGNARLFLQVDSQNSANSARTTLQNAGISSSKIEFIITSNNSIWMRDYGPRYIYEGGVRAIVDHIYNRRSRINDDAFPIAFGTFKNHKRYELPLFHGGGNFHLDDADRGFATRLINNENPELTEQDIKDFWKDYQGLNMTLYDPFPTDIDATQHLDMWAIFVAKNKVIVSDWPLSSGSTQDVICDATAASLASEGYTVYRIPAISDIDHYTYCNAMICNNAVAIPAYSNSIVAPYNAQALAVWQQALSNHVITPVNAEEIVSSAGVMHCIVMHVPANKGGANPTVYVQSFNQPTANPLLAGAQPTIQWISDDDRAVINVDIRLSLNNGATFPVTIASAAANNGTYIWTIPANLNSPAARIKVVGRDANGNLGEDVSDASFVLGNGTSSVDQATWLIN